ncbi:MAG: 3'-5' exonuclease [Candidatus Gastranaerophilaceae bacterium]
MPSANTLELDAVQILTIHASKGLEFPYVFVLSIASSSKTADKSGIIFDMQYGEKPGFGIIASKYKGKPTAKALIYKQLWQKPREKNEALRLFYVAVSRAKKYLNVLSFEPYAFCKTR